MATNRAEKIAGRLSLATSVCDSNSEHNSKTMGKTLNVMDKKFICSYLILKIFLFKNT